MFIGVSVGDCTAEHSVSLIFRFSLSKGRDLVSECFMHSVVHGRCVPFLVYPLSNIEHLAAYIKIALFQHGCNKTN